MPVITVPMLQPKTCETGLLEQQCMGLQSCRGAALKAAKKKLKKVKSAEAHQVKYMLATSGKTEVEYMLEQEYGARETIERVACSSCSTKVTRDRWSEPTNAPDVLKLHLLRLSGSMIGEKINRDIAFPVGEFNVNFAGSTGSPKKKVSYIATAVVRHHGNDPEKDHYTTLGRKCTSPISEWWKDDDSTVSTSPHTEVTKDAYIVILRRFGSILTE